MTDENGPVTAPAPSVEENNGAEVVKETVKEDGAVKQAEQPQEPAKQEVDEFGLPVRKRRPIPARRDSSGSEEGQQAPEVKAQDAALTNGVAEAESPKEERGGRSGTEDEIEKTVSIQPDQVSVNGSKEPDATLQQQASEISEQAKGISIASEQSPSSPTTAKTVSKNDSSLAPSNQTTGRSHPVLSEWSHHQLSLPPRPSEIDNLPEKVQEEADWQDMPAYAPFDMYNDDDKLVAREMVESDDEKVTYNNLGGAGKGYTRVQLDEDAESTTSMDENTAYLFKGKTNQGTGPEEDIEEEARDPLSQMQATKEMLTEGQRIAYVGIVRLGMIQMEKELASLERPRAAKKQMELAIEAHQMWGQKIMLRLYGHMDINSSEQIMIEQLAEHGVQPGDLTPALMQNARVRNPMAEEVASSRQSVSSSKLSVDKLSVDEKRPRSECPSPSPPPYDEHQGEGPNQPPAQSPSELPHTRNIDIDLRWTVLCDLFLLLIADQIYDARSRQLLERVAGFMDLPWLELCRFEKRVTDALEMQEAADKENWNEEEHMERRRKAAKTKRMVMMGLATVGGGLVIGLSAGLAAPLIGAGLAAGFSTFGIAGTGGFLAGAGGAAIITTTGVVTGGTIGVRASHRRTGAVKTFEYRPLHNNKRVNLIVTVSGWMNGKVDDVRLPYSTVDPIMGDIYSVLWEPEMLQSMGATINILATEALTQGLQQILGSTILVGLMSALQLPIVLTKLSYLIDNPWTVSLARAELAGLILADSLIDRNLGTRPITLVGFSLGARVIFYCLRELANKGAFGLVQNVYMFGSPIVAKKDEYLRAKSIVPGRFVNGYATNDWILGYLFRATSGGIMRVAGIAPVEIPGIENHNVTELVPGHMAYRTAMPRLLEKVGWIIESEEFTEIEDPDPDNHAERQRELINEIEEARKQLEEKPEKKRFGGLFGSRKKLAEKKEWETYDERSKHIGLDDKGNAKADLEGKDANILFDIDAIQREVADIAAEGIEVKQLESTLPPMKLDLDNNGQLEERPPPLPLRETKSFNDSIGVSSLASHQQPNGGDLKHQREHELYHHDDELPNDESNISMTFDTAYTHPTSPPRSPPFASSSALPFSPSTKQGVDPPRREWSPPPPALPDRPPMRSSSTMPVSATPLGGFNGIEHNAWADEDEFGAKEGEMKMTFE